MVEPELLLLDEPFSALDQPTREALIGDLGRILREERITTVLVTHDHEEAMVLADRVGVLIGGRLVQLDTTSQSSALPRPRRSRASWAWRPLVECRVLASRAAFSVIEAGGQRMEVAQAAEPGERVRLCLRAEDVTLKTGSPPPARRSPRNRLKGRSRGSAPSGSMCASR